MATPYPQAVYGILFDEERTKVLLIKRRDIPVWVLPGGGLEEGETPEEGACREIREETGYQVKLHRKVAEYLPVNRLTQFTHCFECRILSGRPTLGSETQEIRFFPLLSLPKLLPPPFLHWIHDAHKALPHLLRQPIHGASYPVLLKLLVRHPLLVARFLALKLLRGSLLSP